MAEGKVKRIIRVIKKRKKRTAIIAAAVLAVCGAGGFLLFKSHSNKANTQEATIAETTAAIGTISNTIEGDGNLAAADDEGVSLPEGVSIKTWYVESGDEVKKGDKLAELDAASITSVLATIDSELEEVEDALDSSDLTTNEKNHLNNQLTALTSMQNKLNNYAENPVVTAPAAGVISSVGTTDSTQNTGTEQTVKNMAYEAETFKFVYLATGTDDETETITDFSGFSVTAPVTGAAPQTSVSETAYYTGVISWNPSAKTFAAETVYTATVTLTPKEGYVFSEANLPFVDGVSVSGEVNENTGEMVLTLTFAKTDAEDQKSDADKGSSSKKSSSSSGNTSAGTGAAGSVAAGSASGGSGGGASSGASASAGSGSSVEIISEEDICTIELSDSMLVSINVDEMDITSVAEGQDAQVTVDALDKSFTGNVSRISYEPSSSSSNVKYEVDITVEADEQMRIGMSASATIELSSAENVVTIPMTALQQEGEEMFVYTKKDSDGNLSGKVTVTTGLSDGSTVEIKEGLSEGDTVYYTRSVGSDNAAGGQGSVLGGMGGGQMPGGGGGQMPSGGGEPPSEERSSGGNSSGGQGGPPSN